MGSGFNSFGGVSALSESMRASVGLTESMRTFRGVSALSESMRASVGLTESMRTFGGVSALSESMRASVGLTESMRTFGGVSALSESMRASVGLTESMRTFGGVSALSESMRASVGLTESMRTFGGVSALSESMRASVGLTESMRTSLEDLSSVARFTSYGFTENVRRHTAPLIDSALQEDVIDETSSCDLPPFGVKAHGQRNDLFDPLTSDFAYTKALPVLILLVPLAPALADSGVAAVASILQQYWFAFRILGAVAEVDPAITGLSLVITVSGVMAWLLGQVDRR